MITKKLPKNRLKKFVQEASEAYQDIVTDKPNTTSSDDIIAVNKRSGDGFVAIAYHDGMGILSNDYVRERNKTKKVYKCNDEVLSSDSFVKRVFNDLTTEKQWCWPNVKDTINILLNTPDKILTINGNTYFVERVSED